MKGNTAVEKGAGMGKEFAVMEENWKKIIDFGPRLMGSSASKACSSYLEEEMKRAAEEAVTEKFPVTAWENDGWKLEIEGEEAIPSCLFLESGASEGFEGTLEWLGKNRLWNMYSWDRYGIIDSHGNTVAYVTVRGNGEAIPQMLFTGGSLPHFLVGREDKERIKRAEERKARITGFAHTKRQESTGRNVIGTIGTDKPGKKVVICAHYDTVYDTAGAYDNASGAAVVLELGRRLKAMGTSCPVELLLTDGEEFDLTGARHRARICSPEDTAMVLCIDGVGRDRVLEVWSGPEPFERRVRGILKGVREDFSPVYHCPPPPGSDQEAFYAKGIPACMLTFNDQGILHSPKDIYEENKLHNMKVMVRIGTELLEGLGIITEKGEG
ncbi:M28 family peptidase [Lachnospiraceae bacterium 62-35]